MDTNKQSFENDVTNKAIMPPAQLWLGDPDNLIIEAKKFLQKRWCPNAGCTRCSLCRAIESGQQYNVRWFSPDGWYKREDLEDLFSTIAFSLEDGQEYFFIIQKADCLSSACYNSLLKSIEEPPLGYHFIFFAQRPNDVAPTIRSRCIIHQLNTTETPLLTHPLACLFSNTRRITPFEFLQILEQSHPDEQETIELLDALLGYWLSQSKQSMVANNSLLTQKSEVMISILKTALEEPPMPGSSTLFWKQFFIQVQG